MLRERLPEWRQLTVQRDERAAVFFGQPRYQMACDDERLLVRRRNVFARHNGRHGRPDPDASDQSDHDEIHIAVFGEVNQTLFPFEHLDRHPVQPPPDLIRADTDADATWTESFHLFAQEVDVFTCTEAHYLEALG